MADDGEAGIVGHLHPFVAVDGPGVGALDAAAERSQLGDGAGPEFEGAVDVHPGVVPGGEVRDGVEPVERARVDMTGLADDDLRAGLRRHWRSQPAATSSAMAAAGAVWSVAAFCPRQR